MLYDNNHSFHVILRKYYETIKPDSNEIKLLN